jgi:hypothetical protein
VSRNGRGKGQ